MREINCLVIHHSATPSGSVERFTREHRTKGWATIGYHEVISNGLEAPDGHIGRGRPHDVIGAGVFGANTGKLHVCLVGDFHRNGWFDRHDPRHETYTQADMLKMTKPTRKQMSALGHWLITNGNRYGRNIGHHAPRLSDHRSEAIHGHGTACPGDQFPTGLVRSWYLLHLDGYKDNPPPDLGAWLDKQKGYWAK